MEPLLQLFFVFLLLLLNAFFVASEFALVSLRKTRIDELVRKGNKTAVLLQKSLSNLDNFISATQLGITFASLALGWIGEPTFARIIESAFSFLPKDVTAVSARTVSLLLAFTIITFLHIVIGEIVPKTIALQRSEKVSMFVIEPLRIFSWVFMPFIIALQYTANSIIRIFGVIPLVGVSSVHSEEEIKMILDQSGKRGAIPQKEIEMVHNVFKLGDIPINHIMVPRPDIIAFKSDARFSDVIKKIKLYSFSRFPVYADSIDTVIGFVHVKDIYRSLIKGTTESKLSNLHIIRDILTVPETKKADAVLADMRRKRIHLALISDEYGGTSGMVTLEDILEGLVGEIEDEFDKPQQEIKKVAVNTYLIDGRISIDNVREYFNFPLRGQGYATLGGLVFGLLGREPKLGDSIEISTLSFKIEEMDGKRIKTIRLEIVPQKTLAKS